jgi:hypothetical protein
MDEIIDEVKNIRGSGTIMRGSGTFMWGSGTMRRGSGTKNRCKPMLGMSFLGAYDII